MTPRLSLLITAPHHGSPWHSLATVPLTNLGEVGPCMILIGLFTISFAQNTIMGDTGVIVLNAGGMGGGFVPIEMIPTNTTQKMSSCQFLIPVQNTRGHRLPVLGTPLSFDDRYIRQSPDHVHPTLGRNGAQHYEERHSRYARHPLSPWDASPRSVTKFSPGKGFVPACKYILTHWYCVFVCLLVCPSPILLFSKGK